MVIIPPPPAVTLVGLMILSGRLGVWLRVRFTRSHTQYRLVREKNSFSLVGPTTN